MSTGDDSEVSFLGKQLKLNTRDDAEQICDAIDGKGEVSTLDLRGNSLGIEAAERIAECLSQHGELERCIWSDLFTGRLKTEIPPILKTLGSAMIRAGCSLTEIDLSDNAFGPIGAEGIEELLVSPAAYSLQCLRLNNNGLGAGGKVIASCLERCYDNARRDGVRFALKIFVAGRNRLEVPGALALAKAFKKLGSLEEIVMYQDGINPPGIEALAESFAVNTNLRVIDISDNTATETGSKAIAKALASLPRLEVLNLGDCLCRNAGCHAIVDALRPSIHTSLKRVELSGAELSADAAVRIVDKWIPRFGKVSLVLHSNNFGSRFYELRDEYETIDFGESDDDQGSASEEEGDERDEESADENEEEQMRRLVAHRAEKEAVEVSFQGRQLKLNVREDAEQICDAIDGKGEVSTLDLRGNSLGIEAAERIAECLSQHGELERCIWSDLFTGRLKTEIPPILKTLGSAMIRAGCSLTEIDLSDNAFGPIGAEGIEELLVSPAAYSLQCLRLNNNGLGAGGKVIASCLERCYDNARRDGVRFALKIFVAGRNRLEVPGALALAKAFKKLGSLEEIVMYQDGINPPGIEALAESFAVNTNLRVIDISDNTATETGSKAIAKALASLPRLETLNLGDCLCRDAGCHAIVDALRPSVHTSLKRVELSGAELSAPAAIRIAEKWMPRFNNVSLVLHSNNFGSRFHELRNDFVRSCVEVGESDDDQGSLSDEDERQSETSDDDSDDEVTMSETGQGDASLQLRHVRMMLENDFEQFNSATQEASARMLLSCAAAIAASGYDEGTIVQAIDVADDVVCGVEAVRRRPLSTSTQLVNQVLAQAGVTNVKKEVDWGMSVEKRAVKTLFDALIQRGHFAEQTSTIRHYL